MSFLVYFAVLIVAAAGALFGLDLATSPLPPQKPAAQVAQAPNKLVRREAEERDGKQGDAKRELTPIYPASPGGSKEVRMVYPPTNQVAAAKETTGAAASADNSAPVPAQTPQPVAAADANVATAVPAPVPPAPATQPLLQPAMHTTQAPNQCDVQACASAYRSFRASDCTYQPFEGARRVCEGAPAATQRSAERAIPRSEPRLERTARRSDREAELNAVAERVKEITRDRYARGRYADDDDVGAIDDNAPRRVIVIERGGFWR